MKAPPETIDDVAARARLHLIECERGLGRMTPAGCAARWLVAAGKAPGAPGVRDSKCKECEHGARRHDELSGKARAAMTNRLGKPRVHGKRGSTRVLKVRTCSGCGIEFELRGGCDGNKRYHSEECRQQALARKAPRLRPAPRFANGEVRWCPRCGERLAIGADCTDCAPYVVGTTQRRVG